MKGKQKKHAALCCNMNACDDDDDGGGTSKQMKSNGVRCVHIFILKLHSVNIESRRLTCVLHALQYFSWGFDKVGFYQVELAAFWDHLWCRREAKIFWKNWEHLQNLASKLKTSPVQLVLSAVLQSRSNGGTVCSACVRVTEVIIHAESNRMNLGLVARVHCSSHK